MNGTKKSIGAVTVVLAVVGGVALLGTGVAAATTGVRQLGPQSGSQAVNAKGATELDIEVGAADVRVEFSGEGDEASVRVDGGIGDGWQLSRDGDELQLRGAEHRFAWWQPNWLRGGERVTLVLPQSLRGVDAEITLDAGSLTADGDFGDLDVEVNAGALTVTGSARAIDATVQAGRADIQLDGVSSAEFTVSAGRLVSSLAAEPKEVSIDVSAGALKLTLPDVAYDLRQQVNAGSLNSRLRQDDDSDRRIRATVSAGSVELRGHRD